MNEFEEILDIFGKLVMSVFALIIGIIFLSALMPMVSELSYPIGLGFILIFILMVIATVAEIFGRR